MIRQVLRMGDPRLLRVAKPVDRLDTPELHALVADMFDTMADRDGAGLAAPQIGVDLRVVIFGFESNPRYPQAGPVPPTVLVNPEIEAIGDDEEEGWEGCLSVPGMRGWVPRIARIRYRGFDASGAADRSRGRRLPRARGPARVRPPRRDPLSAPDPRPGALRLHRGALPGRGRRRRLIAA